jgi:hypothetical protein
LLGIWSNDAAVLYWSNTAWTGARTLPQVSDAGQASRTQPAGGWVVQAVIDHDKNAAVLCFPTIRRDEIGFNRNSK